ncbi:MAG: hypothetical protein HY331_05545 [Chloroflexi bacterium]|nr:hypothetical protein [Chloroflexota bacterium]
MRSICDAIVALTDQFCRERLTDEYAQMCRKLAAALSRKRPSPLSSGNVNTWACAIVHTIGGINFLFDRSQTPHVSAADVAAAFGVSKSTAGNKAKVIRDALKMGLYDWHWSLPSRLHNHPLAWMIQVNGLIVDARHLPREIQEEAFRKGLIPYVPSSS